MKCKCEICFELYDAQNGNDKFCSDECLQTALKNENQTKKEQKLIQNSIAEMNIKLDNIQRKREAENNWLFTINEGLHSNAQKLSDVYSRLSYNKMFKNHFLAKTWDAEYVEWDKYEHSIKDMVFDTKVDGLAEIERLSILLNGISTLEKVLNMKPKHSLLPFLNKTWGVK